MFKMTFLVLLGISIAISAFAMMPTLSLPELVKTADLIVIAKVSEKTPIVPETENSPKILNRLSLERVLKGEWSTSNFLEIVTSAPRGIREDIIVLPHVRKKTILFLKKS